MIWQTDVLIEGEACGTVLRLEAPISFWGGIEPVSSRITLDGHPQRGCTISNKILVVPNMIGSSSSSAIMLELLYNGMAPRALILGERDAILPIGVVVSRQMDWPTIPVVALDNPPFRTSEIVSINRSGEIRYTDRQTKD